MLQKLNKLIYVTGAALTTAALTALPVLAEEPATTASASSEMIAQFTSGAAEIKTMLIAVVGAVMGLVVFKLVFKAGVSFFKSAATK